MKNFLNFNLWIPVSKIENPLLQTIYRMQVLFWIKKNVYEPVTDEKKASLKMFSNPEHKEPMTGAYIIKHFNVLSEGKRVKATQYRGSSTIYQRHAYKGAK